MQSSAPRSGWGSRVLHADDGSRIAPRSHDEGSLAAHAALTKSQEVVELQPDAKLLLWDDWAGVAFGHGALEHKLWGGLHSHNERDARAARLRGRGEDEAGRREPQALDEREDVLRRHDVW